MNNMSFVDLATLTLHRRHELESRTHIFEEKCDRAINDIKDLKLKAKAFVSELNCGPSELKERFLNVMQKLDEYIYIITDFNLAMAQTVDNNSTDNTPVQDTPNLQPSLSPFNLMDALTETACLTPYVPAVPCPTVPCPTVPCTLKDQKRLIVFSSSSSAESVRRSSEKETQCGIVDDESVEEPAQPSAVSSPVSSPAVEHHHKECCITAAQTLLEVDQHYSATIMCVSSYSLWVIIEPELLSSFIVDMSAYYDNNKKSISEAELQDMTYCAYCDDGVYYRAMFLQKPERGKKTVNVYVIDTGEEREAQIETVQRLEKQFCDMPPFARLCHLAGLDLGENLNNKSLIEKQYAFMNEYNGIQCNIMIDDNSSESLGIHVFLDSEDTTLNQLMLDRGLAKPIDKPPQERTENAWPNSKTCQTPSPDNSEDEWNITQCPEYEDPVVAVTGYHNRDEADICRHYKGEPTKTCFKGARCTKKHILHHPDGWTLDRVEVVGKCAPYPLPAPGTWLKVLVTTVCHFDRLYVQIIQDGEEDVEREFGVVRPPMTLKRLHRDMNSMATIQAYKRLTIAPALGEIVVALYPPDNCWYRAKVLTVAPIEQSVEVMYVDYGTVQWVKEDLLRRLEARLAALPQQAVPCALAGVRAPRHAALCPDRWASATRALQLLTQDKRLEAHVIARDYDELAIELFTYDDPKDPSSAQSVADTLAERGLIELTEYTISTDEPTQRLVVP